MYNSLIFNIGLSRFVPILSRYVPKRGFFAYFLGKFRIKLRGFWRYFWRQKWAMYISVFNRGVYTSYIYKKDTKGLIYFFVWVHIYKGYVYSILIYSVWAKERDMYTLYIVYH